MQYEHLQAGQVIGTHGVSGEIKILPWADSPRFLLDFSDFYIDGKAFPVLASRVHKTCVLAKLKGIDTFEQAVSLRGQTVCVDRSAVRLPEGAVFIADLIGCRVLDDSDTEIGVIQEVLTLPASDVYVIEGQRSYMIPAVKEFVREIHVAERFVRVHLIEGMANDEN